MVVLCDRVGCDAEARALLVFDPRECSAWLVDLEPGGRTVGIELCPGHADRITVPVGWGFADDRRPGAQHDTPPLRLADEPEPAAPVETPADAASVDDEKIDVDPDDVDRPTLWTAEATADDDELDADDDADSLAVDESTPLLSRAFRAAHID